MRETYLHIIYNYGPLMACITSLTLCFLSFFKTRLKNILPNLSLSLLVLASLISLEFYPFQLFVLPSNLIIPIGVFMVFFLKFKVDEYPRLTRMIVVVFTLYLIFGLGLMSASSNTWGEGGAPFGVFIVANMLMVLLSLFSIQKNQYQLFALSKLFIAVGGFAFVYYSTNGFYYKEYDWDGVRLRRNLSVLICIASFIEGFLIYLQKKHLLIE